MSNHDITCQIYIDGVQAFKSSKTSLTPVQASVNEFPISIRNATILLVGLWAAAQKPDLNLFWRPIIDEELTDLHENGFKWTPPNYEEPINIIVHTIVAPCDSVERCALQNIHQYNGKNCFNVQISRASKDNKN